jgi:flagellum-specific ATP synthase
MSRPTVPQVLPLIPHYSSLVTEFDPIEVSGRVVGIVGQLVESAGPMARLGDLCRIETPSAERGVLAEVVGFRRETLLLMPLGDLGAVGPRTRVVLSPRAQSVPVGEGLLGRVLDPLGNPVDGRGPIPARRRYPVHQAPPAAMARPRIEEPLPLGIRAIDGLLTIGRGQRVGIFAGSGVGKSTLLGAIARHTAADVNVVALIGERGREVREFIERDLGPEGLARSVVIVATGDQPAPLRVKGAFAATAVAEYFRDQGLQVMLMMDSVTRFAWAQREIGLAVGEPPTTRGYTPSVLALLPRLLERAGTSAHGSITGLYTVLVDGDDMNEPVADAARSILDGHIVLQRELAARGHYPAIDVLGSVSRLMSEVADASHREAARAFREIMATYRSAEDLIQIGAYVAGSNPAVDRAIERQDAFRSFLRQAPEERSDWTETLAALQTLTS